jgi:hypothetical protein
MHVGIFIGWVVKEQTMNQNQSEIARLRQQYEAEYEAAQRGLTGLAIGTARHDFITRRMEQMQRCVQDLTDLVGVQQASVLLWGEAATRPALKEAPVIPAQEDQPC